MINIRNCLSNYVDKIDKITYCGKNIIVDSDDKKYLLKVKDSNKRELYSYLNTINYEYFMPLINNYSDSFEIYPYYENRISSNYSIAKELIYALSILHIKSTDYVTYRTDKIKEIFEDVSLKIDNIMSYYLDLQDYIEQLYFPSPANYLLINNISSFYKLLRISRNMLDRWYHSDNLKNREVILVNNLSLNNFRLGEKSYFVDMGQASRGLFVYDLVNFYKANYFDVEMDSLIELYNSKYQLMDFEFYLFFSLIAIPEKISFTKNVFADTLKVRKEVDYVVSTLNYVLEKNKEDQKANENKFKE